MNPAIPIPHVDFEALAPVLLLGVRIGALMTFAPFVGSVTIPWQVKSGFTVALTALLGPAYLARVPQGIPGHWAPAVGGEMMIGLGMGLLLEMVFEAARLAGNLLGFQFGYSLANIIDPQSQVDITVLSFFHYTFLLLIFLQGDAHHWLFRLLVHSFDVVQPGAVVLAPHAVQGIFHMAGGMFLMGLQMAAPALTITLMADIALAFLAKASPQLPILSIGLPVKVLAGYAAIWTGVVFWPVLAHKWFFNAFQGCERLLQAAH